MRHTIVLAHLHQFLQSQTLLYHTLLKVFQYLEPCRRRLCDRHIDRQTEWPSATACSNSIRHMLKGVKSVFQERTQEAWSWLMNTAEWWNIPRIAEGSLWMVSSTWTWKYSAMRNFGKIDSRRIRRTCCKQTSSVIHLIFWPIYLWPNIIFTFTPTSCCGVSGLGLDSRKSAVTLVLTSTHRDLDLLEYMHAINVSRPSQSMLINHPAHCFQSDVFGQQPFSVAGPAVRNWLPDSLRDPAISRDSFRRSLKTFLFLFFIIFFYFQLTCEHSALELSGWYAPQIYLLTYLFTTLLWALYFSSCLSVCKHNTRI